MNPRLTYRVLRKVFRFRMFFLCSVFVSCSPLSLEEVRFEGEAEIKKLTRELACLESKEDLEKALPRLKKRFARIADLLISLKNFSFEDKEPTEAAEKLFIEMARIYEIPGGQELIETAQKNAVSKLLKEESSQNPIY